MKVSLTFVLVLYAGTLQAQSPWLFPYANNAQWQQQQAFDNQLRMRQQAAWEARNPEREYVLEFTEQVARIRALRAQQDYYESMTAPPKQQPLTTANWYDQFEWTKQFRKKKK